MFTRGHQRRHGIRKVTSRNPSRCGRFPRYVGQSTTTEATTFRIDQRRASDEGGLARSACDWEKDYLPF